MTDEVLSGGVASAALLHHAASGSEYLGEISLGLLGKLSNADLLAEVRALEAAQRQVQVAWPGLIGQLEARGLADRLGASIAVPRSLSGGMASAALLDHAASGSEYLGEISPGLRGKLSDADLLAEVRALKAAQRQVQVAWHGLIGQLEQRAWLRGWLGRSPCRDRVHGFLP